MTDAKVTFEKKFFENVEFQKFKCNFSYCTGASVEKVVTVEKSVMKVEPFGAITRLDWVFFKELTDAKVTFEKRFCENVGFQKSKCNFCIALELLCKKL